MIDEPNAATPGYATVAADLRAAGIDTLFGVMGEANLDLIACLSGRHGIRYVAARHEAGAVAMADGFARSSGRLGVATVTCGPGLTNAITPLVTAVRAHAEILLVTGQLPLSATGRSQTIDQVALLAPTGAGIVHVEAAAELPGAVDRAIALVRKTRRPVVLNILMPVLDGAAARGPARVEAEPPAEVRPPPISDETIDRILTALVGADRPVILAGRGAVEAGIGPALRDLADRTGASLAVSLLAHGLFAGHPRDLGVAGGVSSPENFEALAEADLLLALGAGLNGWTTRAGTAAPNATVIHVDRDPAAFASASRPIDLAVQAEIADAVSCLLARLDPAPARRAPPPAVPRAAAPPHPARAGTVDPRAFCRLLDELLPRERTVTVDAGHFFEFPTRFLSVPDERGYLFTIAFGTVGLGLATAAGAALGRPERVSVAFVGDGGLMMSLVDLDTIGRERLPMVIVVLNDGAYGAEIKHLADRGWDVRLAQFTNPDFASLAATLGIHGIRIGDLADPPDLRQVGRPTGPILLDVSVDPSVKAEWMSVMHAARGAS